MGRQSLNLSANHGLEELDVPQGVGADAQGAYEIALLETQLKRLDLPAYWSRPRLYRSAVIDSRTLKVNLDGGVEFKCSGALSEFGSNDRLISRNGLWSRRLKTGTNPIGIESMTRLGLTHPRYIIAFSISFVEGCRDEEVGRNQMGTLKRWRAERLGPI